MGDTGTMYVDSATYLVNIFAEYYKDGLGERGKALEIGASFVSAFSLVGITAYVMTHAVMRLGSEPGEEEDVNPGIMLFFTVCNIFIDLGMFLSIVLRRTGGLYGCILRRCRCIAGRPAGTAGARGSVPSSDDAANHSSCGEAGGGGGQSAPLAQCASSLLSSEVHAQIVEHRAALGADGSGGGGGGAGGGPDGSRGRSDSDVVSGLAVEMNIKPSEELNLCSAFAHVIADTMRTFTVLACALLVALGGLDSERTDAIASLVVSIIILFVAAYIFYEATVQLAAYRGRAAPVVLTALAARTGPAGQTPAPSCPHSPLGCVDAASRSSEESESGSGANGPGAGAPAGRALDP